MQPPEFDIMGIRGAYHAGHVKELVANFQIWREERLPGSRAFQSKYDRVGIMVCKWLYQTVHDIQASSAFDYILPLMVRFAVLPHFPPFVHGFNLNDY